MPAQHIRPTSIVGWPVGLEFIAGDSLRDPGLSRDNFRRPLKTHMFTSTHSVNRLLTYLLTYFPTLPMFGTLLPLFNDPVF